VIDLPDQDRKILDDAPVLVAKHVLAFCAG
jgi:hypothetical protein